MAGLCRKARRRRAMHRVQRSKIRIVWRAPNSKGVEQIGGENEPHNYIREGCGGFMLRRLSGLVACRLLTIGGAGAKHSSARRRRAGGTSPSNRLPGQ